MINQKATIKIKKKSELAPCWACGKINHKAKDYFNMKGQTPKFFYSLLTPNPQVNMVIMRVSSSIPTERYLMNISELNIICNLQIDK